MKTMMNLLRHRLTITLFSLSVLFAPVAMLAQTAQRAANNTTTNGAITATATSVVLTSATAIAGSSFGAPAAGQCIYFADNNDPDGLNSGELARIASMSSTTATLNRGPAYGGSTPTAHASGTRVFTASCDFFQKVDPPSGTCTQSQSPLPWININNGNVARCIVTGWTLTNATAITYNSIAPGLPW